MLLRGTGVVLDMSTRGVTPIPVGGNRNMQDMW